MYNNSKTLYVSICTEKKRAFQSPMDSNDRMGRLVARSGRQYHINVSHLGKVEQNRAEQSCGGVALDAMLIICFVDILFNRTSNPPRFGKWCESKYSMLVSFFRSL